MIDTALLASLKGSDCIDDVCETIGTWANGKYTDVCEQLDEANEIIAALQECVADNTSDELKEAKRIIQELKDELEGNVASKEASKQTVFQLEHENECLELWYHKYVQLEGKYKQLNDNSVERRRYDAMLTDYIDLVSKVKDGTALSYIMSLK